MSSLSIIIPAHQDGEAFRRCLSSVLASSQYAPDVQTEIIVVSDGGPESLRAAAREAGVQVVHTPVSQGPAYARNCGADRAEGDLLFFVDADVVLHEDTVQRLVETFEHDPDCDAVVGSYDDAPDDPGFFSQYRNLLHHYVHQQSAGETFTFWGACGAIRQNAFWASGGFDAEYERPCIEDVEFGIRIRRHGFRTRMCPSIQVTHLKQWDAASMVKTDVLDRAMPWTQLLLDEGNIPDSLNLRWKDRWSTVLAFLLPIVWLAALVSPAPTPLAGSLTAWGGVLVTTGFLVLNAPLYAFFWRKRGVTFSLRTIPWHWTYFICCGAGAALGGTAYLLSRAGIRHTPLHDLLPRSV